MNDQQLSQYFGTLRRSTVPTSRRYLVWHVNPDGTISSRNLLLKKGTGVFVDRGGRIVLKESCGNPMVSGEVARRDLTESKPPVTAPAEEVAVIQPTAPEVIATQPDVIAPAVIPPAVVETAPPVVTAAPPVVIPETTAVAPPIIPAASVGGGGGGNFLPFLAIPVLGGAILGGGHGGGGHTPPPVPEPSSIVALTAGIGLVMARRRKKRD
jgi:hypothetical protein